MCSRFFPACAPPTCCPGGRVYRSYADPYMWSGFGAPCCISQVRCSPCGVSNAIPYPFANAAAVVAPVGPPSIQSLYLGAAATGCGFGGVCNPVPCALPVTCVTCQPPYGC